MSANIIDRFDSISLKQMEELSLMNRTDTKFVFHERRLEEFLTYLQSHYQVLQIRDSRIMPYHSTYYDSPGMYLYHCHHNGMRARYKIRFRDYLHSDISFLEIKKKTNKEKTKKKRMQVPYHACEIKPEYNDFMKKYFPLECGTLVKSLENNFSRITLAGFPTCERVTIDMQVNWTRGDRFYEMPGVVITEVKRGIGCSDSPVMKALKEMRIYPASFSKYCMGVVALYDDVKKNNFKPKILKIKKILQ